MNEQGQWPNKISVGYLRDLLDTFTSSDDDLIWAWDDELWISMDYDPAIVVVISTLDGSVHSRIPHRPVHGPHPTAEQMLQGLKQSWLAHVTHPARAQDEEPAEESGEWTEVLGEAVETVYARTHRSVPTGRTRTRTTGGLVHDAARSFDPTKNLPERPRIARPTKEYTQ